MSKIYLLRWLNFIICFSLLVTSCTPFNSSHVINEEKKSLKSNEKLSFSSKSIYSQNGKLLASGEINANSDKSNVLINKSPNLNFNVKSSENCLGTATFTDIARPEGCNNYFEIIQNGVVLQSASNPPLGVTFSSPIVCGCGHFDVSVRVTYSGSCAGLSGTYTIISGSADVECTEECDIPNLAPYDLNSLLEKIISAVSLVPNSASFSTKSSINNPNQNENLILENINLQKNTLRNEINQILGSNDSRDKSFNLSSLQDYKNKILLLDSSFELWVNSKDVFGKTQAASVIADELELYNLLVKNYISGNITNLSLATSDDIADLDRITDPKDLIKYLSNQIKNQPDKIKNSLQFLSQDLEKISDELDKLKLDNQRIKNDLDKIKNSLSSFSVRSFKLKNFNKDEINLKISDIERDLGYLQQDIDYLKEALKNETNEKLKSTLSKQIENAYNKKRENERKLKDLENKINNLCNPCSSKRDWSNANFKNALLGSEHLKHLKEWIPALTEQQYLDKARDLLGKKQGGNIYEHISETNGKVYKFNENTGELAIGDNQNNIVTFFKPGSSPIGSSNRLDQAYKYFLGQIKTNP